MAGKHPLAASEGGPIVHSIVSALPTLRLSANLEAGAPAICACKLVKGAAPVPGLGSAVSLLTLVGAGLSKRLSVLHQTILEIRDLIISGEFQGAEAAVRNQGTEAVKALGIAVNVGWGNPEKNKYNPDGRTVIINLRAPRPQAASSPPIANPQDDIKSTRDLFMALEELMHVYQDKSDSYFSPATSAYEQTDQAKEAVAAAGGIYDFHEIDVLAALQDWNVNVEELEYVELYDEREHFFEWREQNP